MKKNIKKLNRGFTLVELVVTITIIAILSVASVATYFGITTNARRTAARSDANEVLNLVRTTAMLEDNDYGLSYGPIDAEVTPTVNCVKISGTALTGTNDIDKIVYFLNDVNSLGVTAENLSEVDGAGAAVTGGELTDGMVSYVKLAYNGGSYTIDFTTLSVK